MKALMVYFTMGGRTKKMAEAIASSLSNYDVTFFPFELKGSFIGKIRLLDEYENGDYSSFEGDFSILDAEPYDLILIGMPTYGSNPPKTFYELTKRMNDLHGKSVVVFGTSRFRRGSHLQVMKDNIEAKGGKVIEQRNFRGLLLLGTKKALEFGNVINEL
ncbi:MAG: flavodoxin family protein [Candidatus Thorarchaeota archaeon]